MRKIDWEGIQREYRAGQLSLMEIARQFGLSDTAIRKRAKQDNWKRDLSGEIRAEIRERLVRASSTPEPRTSVAGQDKFGGEFGLSSDPEPVTDAEIIASAAERGVAVVEFHKGLMRDLREDIATMRAELREDSASGVGSLTARAGVLMQLTNATVKLIPHERKALALDEPPPPLAPSDGSTPVLDRMLAELAKRRRNLEATEMEDDADDGGRY